MDELNLYVDKLIEEKGLSDFEEDILDDIRADLHAQVEDRINAVILSKLPPEQLGAFEKVLDSGDSDKMQEFCKRHIPDVQQVIAEELLAFRATYLG